MTKFKLKIITPQGIYQEVEIDQINLDTTAGQIGILAHHIPLASGVKVSQMNYIIDGKRTYFSVAGGFIYVNETETTLIANAIESQEEIDLERAQEAKRRAEEKLNQKITNKDNINNITVNYTIKDDAVEAEVTYEVFENIGTNEKIVF